MNCTYHITNQLSFICIAPHICKYQRKLCIECLDEHGVDMKYAIPIKKFQQMVKKKLQDDVLYEQFQIPDQKMNFKSILSPSKNNLMKILEDLSQSVKQIFNMIELPTTQYDNLINQNINLVELSNYDLENLIQILQGKNIKDWIEQKNYYLNKLEELRVYWDQEEKLFISKIQDKLSGVLSIIEQYSSKFTGETKEIQKSYFQFKALQITTTEQMARNKEQNFVKDNSGLKKDSILKEPENLTNLEQIQHLKWVGKYGQNNKKIGLWEATWYGEKIQSVGGEYSFEGKKQGKWIEIIKNYQSLAQVFKVGQYVKDQKQGFWKYVYENREMYKLINQFNNNRGGGAYSPEGLKIGKWIVLSKGFWKYSQVTHQGEYHKGKKVGKWDIFNRKYKSGSFSKMQTYFMQFQNNNILEKKYISGGGSYDYSGAEVKIGDWVEMMDRFNSDCQIMSSGRYQNGKKIGRWNLYNKKHSMQKEIITIFCNNFYQWWWII